MGKSLICGVGINDADYAITWYVHEDGKRKRVICPFYRVWHNMLSRCYSENSQIRQPTYTGCSVVPEWLYFTTFRSWMFEQDWYGNHLDKDLLLVGNKIYGPDTCIFVSPQVNTFFLPGRNRDRSTDIPTGVYFHEQAGKFAAVVGNLGRGKTHLGLFDSSEAAHEAYVTAKTELAKELAGLQKDERIYKLLLSKYKVGI